MFLSSPIGMYFSAIAMFFTQNLHRRINVLTYARAEHAYLRLRVHLSVPDVEKCSLFIHCKLSPPPHASLVLLVQATCDS